MNLLLDTDVFVDFVGRRPPFFESAERIVAAGYFADVRLWVSNQSMESAFRTLKQYASPKDVQRAMVQTCDLVSPVGLSADEMLRAARLEWDDYSHCLIALCAEKVKASYIITRRPEGFARSCVKAISPEEWLNLIEQEKGLTYETVELDS